MKKTIFFVEDEKSLSDTLAEFLRNESYNVEIAHNGTEALRMISVVRPDLILLDIILPEMSGIDFLKEIQKEGSEFANIPVLVLTNLQGNEGQFQQLGLKVVGYFTKANTSLKDLGIKIKEILGNQ